MKSNVINLAQYRNKKTVKQAKQQFQLDFKPIVEETPEPVVETVQQRSFLKDFLSGLLMGAGTAAVSNMIFNPNHQGVAIVPIIVQKK